MSESEIIFANDIGTDLNNPLALKLNYSMKWWHRIIDIQWSPDGEKLLLNSEEGNISILDAKTHSIIFQHNYLFEYPAACCVDGQENQLNPKGISIWKW